MFGIGWTELIVIALVVLVFVGPKNLPPLLRKVGGIMAELKSASRELRNQIDAEVADLDISPKKMAREIEEDLLKAASDPYEELRQAEREIREDLKKTDREITEDLRKTEGEITGDLKKTGEEIAGELRSSEGNEEGDA